MSEQQVNSLISRLETAMVQINSSKEATLANVNKDRIRAKLRKAEMDLLMEDYQKNIKVEEKELDETVKSGVEQALLKMTEKKIIADTKMEQM